MNNLGLGLIRIYGMGALLFRCVSSKMYWSVHLKNAFSNLEGNNS